MIDYTSSKIIASTHTGRDSTSVSYMMIDTVQYNAALIVGEKYEKIRSAVHESHDWQLERSLVEKLLGANDQNRYWNLVQKHPEMRDALDELLPIKCLWPGMRLSTFHKIFPMKCDEVSSIYQELL